MGYYTDYKLDIYYTDGRDATDTISCGVDVEDIVRYPEDYRKDVIEAVYALRDAENHWCYGILSEERCKWYDYEKDMKELSERFPNLVFILHGEGEEQGDIWTAYFCNGRTETIRPELKWPYFDIKEFAEGA